MKPLIRAALAAMLAFLFSAPALALEQFAPSTKPVTHNTACGAPGVGYSADGEVLEGVHRNDEAHIGQRVNADGVWEQCSLAFDCRSTVLNTPKRGYRLAPRALPNAYISPTGLRTVRVIGPRGPTDWRGSMRYACTGTGKPGKTGGWVLVDS